ncbi:hypothetical protein WOLCODRAFT_141073 [Wolfiporia cocos MD-104 SS10]|uniref:UBC core domain-containing protein n=1 Tax=Wolfiporia cocos (strain MD-104) TaxID=742152 RepID=A0A2H3JBS9_WOLCO|nr:hypothetical protein WOLCODRAFT_141073 [Wolfiporia cocos MD-104 SS10]
MLSERPTKRPRVSGHLQLPSPPPPDDSELGSSPMNTMAKPSNSRGRHRFLADLEYTHETLSRCELVVNGLIVKDLKTQDGEDEGAFECRITFASGKHLVTLKFTVSDMSEYPSDHTFFCETSDLNVPAAVSGTIETIFQDGSLTIEQMLNRLLVRLSGNVEGDEEEDGDLETYTDASDDDMGMDLAKLTSINTSTLQCDLKEVIENGFRPGIISLGTDQFVISVSLPVVDLVRFVAPHALVALDLQLLARAQNFTLLLSGFHSSYPILNHDGTLRRDAAACGTYPAFKVGLSPHYKPQREHVVDAFRRYGLKDQYAIPSPKDIESEIASLENAGRLVVPPDEAVTEEPAPTLEPEPEPEQSSFQSFSLSSSLETLMNHYFLRVVQIRIQYDLGWAGAETLCWEAERVQQTPKEALKGMRQEIRLADEGEEVLARSYSLPPDPLLIHGHDKQLNLPLLAYCYLLRRLTLCSRYCIVCHRRLNVDFEALKPYVCNNKLCSYQYYNFNLSSSLEYEICVNTEVVDLLVTLAYIAAADQSLDESLPVGLGLRVSRYSTKAFIGNDGLCDFDSLTYNEMCDTIAQLIACLPPIENMKKHLEKFSSRGMMRPKLKDLDRAIPEAAWMVLRWCVASCTAHLEELVSPEDRLRNVDPTWRQFRFIIGAPDAEARYKHALQEAQSKDPNSLQYPSLYAFHGSPVKNWHSIIRHGLRYKTVAHGRAHGNGVYFAREGSYSFSGFSKPSSSQWENSSLSIRKCLALAEIVNRPLEFVHRDTCFVVANTEWILCRYLLVATGASASSADFTPHDLNWETNIPFVAMDPRYPTTLFERSVLIPDPSFKLKKVLATRREEYIEDPYDEHDMELLGDSISGSLQAQSIGVDEWVHDIPWVEQAIIYLLPPPVESSVHATMALQRELKLLLKEQEHARSLRELGWYLPLEFIGDNLFQWIVELHSFEPDLPIAQDMKTCGVNSLVFEIRFPPSYPYSPPFFRIIKPRFLPFMQGGGGHVTSGGSICMDLLTADGWLPSYSVSAVLLQIRLAISNCEPRPARLAQNWQIPYGMQEAVEGFRRAANTHGWKVPDGLDKLIT